jgi:hypothetical protein
MLWLAFRGALRHAGFMPTDLPAWQNDWKGVVGCLVGASGALPCAEPISKFPLAYLGNSLLFRSGFDRGQLLLALVNGLALAVPPVMLAFSQGFGALRRAGWPYFLAVALSPLPMFYIATGALEVQAGVFCGVYMGAFARILASPDLRAGTRTAWVAVISGLIFPLYKDTAALLVGTAALGTLVWRFKSLHALASTKPGRERLWRTALVLAGPVLLGQFLDLGYCWFKYGVPLPLAYLTEAAEAGPSYVKSAEFLLGSLLSPNGGIVIFWFLPVFIAVLGWRLAGLEIQRTTVFLACATAVVFWVALSRWWTPFGWDGWGNRLMVPAMVAVIAALPFGMRPRQRAAKPPLNWAVCLACAPFVVYSFYYVAIPYSQSQARSMQDSLRPGPDCARMSEHLATPQASAFWRSELYYSCASERMLYMPRPHIRTH